MPSNHFDIWAGIGTIASSAIAVYGWLYSIGLAQLFMFIAGACFTMLAQERLEKKFKHPKVMRDYWAERQRAHRRKQKRQKKK